ncbi:pentapeptide repeat-containing protein [Maricaulis alexandrii]|uniref:pentapeptide repeat-containing protein n=1 Tax=Maricaulis alexandrii TaxID=2570354 RepID=UPI001109B2C3|nr:pentapeptide repeat-containing protein [Maricaulis alexandrii]
MLSEDEKQAAIKAADEEWWKGWWEEDFSWEGLARLDERGRLRHPWRGWSVIDETRCVPTDQASYGSRAATLQDYLRWDFDTEELREDIALAEAGLLIVDDVPAAFHILHLPEQWPDGSKSWKAQPKHGAWKTVATELANRLSHGGATKTGRFGYLIGTDFRAQLTGIQIRVLPGCPKPNDQTPAPLHLVAAWTRWLETADFTRQVFGSSTSFAAAQFSGGVSNFIKAQFLGAYVTFYKAQFSGGGANFCDARFSGGDANFSNAQFSGGGVIFRDAKFSGGDVSFHSAQFSGGDASFTDVQFSGGDARFDFAQFSGGYAHFNNAQFSGGDASYNAARFSGGNVSFHNAQFSGGDVRFGNAQFSGGEVSFCNAQFSGGDARFYNAQFSGGDANFNSILSVGNFWSGVGSKRCQAATHTFQTVLFNDAVCLGRVDFTNRDFGEPAEFAGALFFGRATFHGARIHEGTNWKNARFRFSSEIKPGRWAGRYLTRSWVQRAVLACQHRLGRSNGPVSDDHISFPTLPTVQEKVRQRARRDLSDHETIQLRDTFAASLDCFQNRGSEAYSHESDYRTLKRLMEHIGARNEEQRFFALELKARRARRLPDPSETNQTRDHDVKAWEAFFAGLYGAISDYGQSLTRIFGWLGGLWVVMAGVYLCLALTVPRPAPTPPEAGRPRLVSALNEAAPPPPTRWQQYMTDNRTAAFTGPLLYSLEMTLVPVVNPGGHHPWTDALEAPGAGRHPYWFALVRMVHRLLSIPLLFLFLLTLRRRFQID